MEHITDKDKKDDFKRCQDIVKTTIALEKIQLSHQELLRLTKEIMDTSLSLGGDFSSENIRFFTLQYIRNNFLSRFQKTHQ